MEAKPQQQKRRERAISALNVAIEGLNLAKELSSITPAKVAFGSVNVILTMIKDTMTNETDYVELGLACAEVCRALDRGLDGKRLNEIKNSVCEAINQLTTAVGEIQMKIIEQGKRDVFSRHFHAKSDKDKIAGWRSDLDRILHVFNTELAINTHVMVSNTHTMVSNAHRMVSDMHRTIVKCQEGSDGKNLSLSGTHFVRHRMTPHHFVDSNQVSNMDYKWTHYPIFTFSTLGESPPGPRACFGRDELIGKVVDLAENLKPVALVGPGGIGKTSIALTVLHHDRIKQQFGDNRRFIRCDQFTTSCGNFLSRLSEVIGSGVENPKDLASLRPFLSSKKVLIILDNTESILDPQGMDAREICALVEELSQLETVWLCITSRITTVPRYCKRPVIPMLSIEAACDIFYGIYGDGERSDVISDLLRRLDFHALSISLLATIAVRNVWDYDRLAKEWDMHRTQVLRTDYNESLAATIELSLASPMFRELGPDARDLLGVLAFFPQGINENNVDWLFPTISNNVLDKFCALSLAHRTHGFITMLAPLRDYLSPKDPKSSSLLCATKELYFSRMSTRVCPTDPKFKETRWIRSEDVNVEHLLGVFTTIDASSDSVWYACIDFMLHLVWHKRRLVTLQPQIEGLSDNHRLKSECLFQLSRLFSLVGHSAECIRLLTHALNLGRERGSDEQVANILMHLSGTNRKIGLTSEGKQQAKESLEIFERLGDTLQQGNCWIMLAVSLNSEKQLDAAEEAALRAHGLFSEKGNQYNLCGSHRVLGDIYRSKGEKKKAIHHLEAALGIASPFNWHEELFWAHLFLTQLFLDDGRFDEANSHIERAKSHTDSSAYDLGRAMEEQAWIWYKQRRFEEARSEALRAADVFERLGAMNNLEDCRMFLRYIEKELDTPSVASSQSDSDCELL